METINNTADSNRKKFLRLFIALTLPEAIKDQVEKAQADLRRALPIGCVRWTSREQFHLTLKFLGSVDAERVEALIGSLNRTCESLPAMRLRAEGIGFFPQNAPAGPPPPTSGQEIDPLAFATATSLHSLAPRPRTSLATYLKKQPPRLPRVIWVGVKDSSGNLQRLQTAVEEAMRDFTREKSEHFAGHVTLGRVKDLKRHEAEGVVKLAASVAARYFGKWTADHVELLQSDLLPGGAQYTTLAAAPLLSTPPT